MSNSSEPLDRRALLQQALQAVEEMQAKLDAVEQARREPIAIIGLGCRFPRGANSPEAFWQLLRDNVDAVTEIPPDRWDVDAYYDANPDAMGKMYTRRGAFLDALPDQFDAAFFGISPREAVGMDPQQRLLLEVSWEALENAGVSPNSLAGSQTGVFVGMSTTDYAQMQARLGGVEIIDTYFGSGVAHSIAAGRVSYTLGLHGPCVTVDTACSSSLTAIHLAVQSLHLHESDLALAGGVNLTIAPDGAIATSRGRMLSADGHCKTFDASADGYVRGEGCGVVVLKRLSDAIAEGDTILALVRGTAINQDGRSNGLTAPHGPSQEAVIRAALANAGLEPDDVGYIEAHGTGTSLGDPIEVNALGAVLGPSHSAEAPLVIGAVKSNIGHLEAAAGVAGLIKIVLAMQNGLIPSNLHFRNPNPLIPWNELPIKIPTQNLPWPAGGKRRVAGVSSFGFSGTNAHLIIEEAPQRETAPVEVERPLHLLALSAKGEPALRELARRFAETPSVLETLGVSDICFTANTGRSHFSSRVALTADSIEQLRGKLAAVADGGTPVNTVSTKNQPRAVFLFTGQGSQYAGMARQLYETQPSFRKTLDRCDEILRPYLNQSLISNLYPPPGAPSLLDETAYTQPALFAVEYALAELWRSWGVEPTAVLGHSVGEYVAACVAGVFSLEDGLKLIAERGRLMGALPPGGEMAAVFADEARVTKAIAAHREAVSIAAVNGPKNIVISGAGAAVQAIVKSLEAEGIKSRRLVVSHAFHSPLMEPMLDEFERVASQVDFAAPQIGVVSNVTGQVAAADDLTNADYWRRHVRGAVRFADSIRTLQKQGYDLFIEIGPKPTLLSMGQQCWPGEAQPAAWLPSLREGRDDWQSLLDSLGALYIQGLNVDWAGFDADYPSGRRKVTLPTYPFQRTRYWFTLPQSSQGSQARARQVIHPLLHQRLRSSALREAVFESELNADWPSFLKDHQIYETVIFPGTGYLEMALAAAAQLGPEGHALESVSIHSPLMLPEGEPRVAQLVLSPVENGRASFKILSLEVEDSNETWKLHAAGEITVGETAPAETGPAPAFQGGEAVDVGEYYQNLRDLGVDYGPTFRGVKQLWRGDGSAWGEIQLPPEAGDVQLFHLHPALLDACFHVVGAALPHVENGSGEGDVYLPVGMGRLVVHKAAQAKAWARVTARLGKDTVTSDLELFDDSGQLVAELQGLTLKRASRQALRGALQKRYDDWFYEVAWRIKALSDSNKTAKGHWLVFADQGGVGEALAARFVEQGATCELVFAGEAFVALEVGRWQINPSRPEDFTRLMREGGPRDGIVYLWSAEGNSPEAMTIPVLHLVQALAAGDTKPGLWLVTRGGQTVMGKGGALAQSPIWGLGKVIALEHPDLRCVRLDLDPSGETDEAGTLLAELTAGDGEPQVARRSGARYVARMIRANAKITSQPFEVTIASRGVLDHLNIQPLTRRQPGPGEVEVEVRASGLNFRDVLNVLGMYPGDPGQPGTECAGLVTAVGEGVTGVKVGDSVVGVATKAFSSYVLTGPQAIVPKPEHLSFAEAATIPIAFMTAYYGLHDLAKMKPGARVLIHAAAGGVGLAAVQLAQQAGAEIFGTAGSPEKRAYLKSLGVQHVMSSRTLDFADEVMKITNGQGVDIVLNALADDFITKSVSVLAEDGCFLEIGKRGVWTDEQMKAVKPGVRYFLYDLSEVLLDMPRWQSMLQELMAGFERGALRPLPLHAFAAREVVDAFRFMAQAKHTGKVVIAHKPTGELLQPDASYLITGGLGGLGLKVAQWMVEQGARHLALVGRSSASGEAGEAIHGMEGAGAQVKVFKADMSQRDQIAKVLAEIAQVMPALRGVIHAAGVLDDGVLVQQDRDRFAKVMAPKVAGAAALHELTHGLPLDFFVLFSSASSLLGSPGQGNYAAANAFMDALAQARQAQGLPALSINWGAWSEVGMAAAQGEREQRRWASQGMGLIAPEQGVQAFGEVLRLNTAQVGILPIHWPKLSKQFGGNVPPFYSEVAGAAASADSGGQAASGPDVIKQLEAAAPEERYDLLLAHVQEQVARVFGLDPAKPLDRRQALSEMGMDSLMSVELKNRLQSSLGRSLPTTLAFDYPTIEALAGYLAAEVLALAATPGKQAVAGENGDQQAEILVDVDQLSDQEVDSLLNTMFAKDETQL